MRCQKIEKWVSDCADGAISKRKKAKIEAHIEVCSACRTFRNQIEQIDEEARKMDVPEVSPEQSRDFSSRLRSALVEIEEGKNRGVLHAFRNKWVFIPASAIMVSLFILIFVCDDKGNFQEEESYVFSFGNIMEEIYRDMGNDPALQEAFHSLVSASLNEMLAPPDWDETSGWEDDVFFWEELSEEELGNLKPAIKKDRNS